MDPGARKRKRRTSFKSDLNWEVMCFKSYLVSYGITFVVELVKRGSFMQDLRCCHFPLSYHFFIIIDLVISYHKRGSSALHLHSAKREYLDGDNCGDVGLKIRIQLQPICGKLCLKKIIKKIVFLFLRPQQDTNTHTWFHNKSSECENVSLFTCL